MRTIHPRRTLLILVWIAALTRPGLSQAPVGCLFLTSGDYLTGAWRDCPDAGLVRWQPEFVDRPYEFEWGSIAYATLPASGGPKEPMGALRFDLVGGDVLLGDLLEVSPEWFTISSILDDSLGPQPLRVSRASVRGVTRNASGAAFLYTGPNDLSEWKSSKADDWRFELGALSTTAESASASNDLRLPHLALIEVELSWNKRADFSLELGVSERRLKMLPQGFEVWIQAANGAPVRVANDQPKQTASTAAFRLEMVSNHLIAMRETEKAADLALLQEFKPGAARTQLRLYLDQNNNRLIVTSPTGEQLADLRIGSEYKPFDSGIRLNNRKGDVRLERLCVSEWNGVVPAADQGKSTRVTLKGGGAFSGEVVGYQVETHSLLIQEEITGEPGGKAANPRDQAEPTGDAASTKPAEGAVGSPSEDQPAPAAEESSPPSTPQSRVVDVTELVSLTFPTTPPAAPVEETPELSGVSLTLHGGARITGAAHGVVDHRLRFTSPKLEGPIDLPLTSIRALRSHSSAASDEVIVSKKKLPRLETNACRSVGTLAGAADTANASCLLWRPRGSKNAAALLDDTSGRLIFRETIERKQTPQEEAQNRAATNRSVLGAIASIFTLNKVGKITTGIEQPSILYLRAGDKLPCKVDRITEQGVHFESSYSSADFVRHEHVKAIELLTTGVDGRVTKQRRDQLLTLPRMQQDNPPTHLLVSTKGDYLRCRLLGLTDQSALIEIHLEEIELDRLRIARIIWLDPPPREVEDKVEDDEEESDPQPVNERVDNSNHLRVQAIRRDGVRLTFSLEKHESLVDADQKASRSAGAADNARLLGTSRVLQACSLELADIDALLLGDRIEQAAAELAYQRWKMRSALQPREDNDSPGGDASTGFPLVGKPAPELRLPFFKEGEPQESDQFEVSAYKGKVLVLDFWASWCGPCMQAMPIIDGLGEEFADQGVQVVAVNMQDAPEEISAALDRLKIDPLIALDRDGVAAQRYEVTGIPQTVVIDREGNVAHVFVGGGPRFEEQLRAAIAEVASGDARPAD